MVQHSSDQPAPTILVVDDEDYVADMIATGHYSRVVNGKLALQKRIPKEDLLKNMPVRHNLSTLPV